MDKNGKRKSSCVLDTGINTVPFQYFKTEGRVSSSIFSWPLKKKDCCCFCWMTD